jgi:hypothetical protein
MLTPSETTLEQQRQLRELEAQYPTPTWEDVLPDWKWVHAWLAHPDRDPQNQYGDRWIAVLNQTIVGVGCDPLALRIAKARELGVHPERLVLTYSLGEWKGPW